MSEYQNGCGVNEGRDCHGVCSLIEHLKHQINCGGTNSPNQPREAGAAGPYWQRGKFIAFTQQLITRGENGNCTCLADLKKLCEESIREKEEKRHFF